MPGPSRVCDLHHSSRQYQILSLLSEARDRTPNLMVPSQIRFCCAMTGTPLFYFILFCLILFYFILFCFILFYFCLPIITLKTRHLFGNGAISQSLFHLHMCSQMKWSESSKGFFLRLPSSDTFSFIAPQIIPDFVDRFKYFLEFAIFLEFPFLCLLLFLVLSLFNYFMCLVHGLNSPFKISLPKTWSPWLMCPVLTGCQEMAHSLLMFYSPLQEQLLPSWSELIHQSPPFSHFFSLTLESI